MTQALPAILSLVGLRCSGKSSVGRRVAELSGFRFIDLDDALTERFSLEQPSANVGGAGDVLTRLGEGAFRDLEAATLRALLDEAAQPLVLATGGGIIERSENRELLRERTTCVWLRAEVKVLAARMRADATSRPALSGDDPVAEIERIAARRNPVYESLAHFTFDADSDDIDGVAQSVTKRCLSRES